MLKERAGKFMLLGSHNRQNSGDKHDDRSTTCKAFIWTNDCNSRYKPSNEHDNSQNNKAEINSIS